METTRSFEAFVTTYKTTRLLNPENNNQRFKYTFVEIIHHAMFLDQSILVYDISPEWLF